MGSEKFIKLAQSFYGCTSGNIYSPVWLCGLEWGGGYDPRIPILEQQLIPYDLEEIQTISVEDFKNSFWAPRSKYCQGFLKILIELYNSSISDPTEQISNEHLWDTSAKKGIVGPKGIALALNAYPISFESRAVADKVWKEYKVRAEENKLDPKLIKDYWAECCSFIEYKSTVIQYRSKTFIKARQTLKPKLIICFGKNEKEQFKSLWGIKKETIEADSFSFDDDPELSNSSDKGHHNCWGYWIDETLVVIVPFFTGTHGLNSDKRIRNTCQQIKILFEKNGKKWPDFKKFVQESANFNLQNEEADAKFKKISELRKLSGLIDEYQNLINKQLVCLKEIEEEIKIDENLDFLSNEDDDLEQKLKDRQENLCNYMHDFDKLKKKVIDKGKSEHRQFIERVFLKK